MVILFEVVIKLRIFDFFFGGVPSHRFFQTLLQARIKARREFKIFYKKNTGILSEIILGNIEKEKSKSKELNKGNK